jgi:hypothetical protein
MDQVLMLEGPYIKDGFIQASPKPGLGITLILTSSGRTWRRGRRGGGKGTAHHWKIGGLED